MAKDYNKLKMENDRIKKNLYEKSLEMDNLKITIKSFDSKEREYEKKIIGVTTHFKCQRIAQVA
jgi:predicted  nucleic acid-binding Zn-ribbon protein